VAAWESYPHWRPDEKMQDKILILEDTNGDGKTDRVKTFAGDLHNPISFEFWGKGVIVSLTPGIEYLEDTNGDDVYDVRIPLIGGLDTADTHHASNSFTLDPAGTLFFQEGTFQHSQGETPWGPPVRVANGAVFKYEPRTGKFGLYTSYSFANPHGHAFSRWGDDIVVDGTGAVPYWGSVFSTRLDGMDKHSGAPSVYKQRTRPCPGIEFLSSPHFPADLQGNLLVGNVIGFQGILQYTMKPGANPAADAYSEAIEVEPIVSSSDPELPTCRPEDGARWGALFHRLAESDHRPHAAQPPRSQPRPDPWPRLPRGDGWQAAREADADRGPARARTRVAVGRSHRPRPRSHPVGTLRPAGGRGGACCEGVARETGSK
jgi:hypothetical protein